MVDIEGLGLGFCLTFVRGHGPDEVISLLGGADPVTIVSSTAALEASGAVDQRADEEGETQPTRLDYVVVTRSPTGRWSSSRAVAPRRKHDVIMDLLRRICSAESAPRGLSCRECLPVSPGR